MNRKSLERRLTYLAGRAVREYRMIEEGDRIMVCLSGGKDSYTLLEVLRLLQRRAPVRFELVAVNLDQKQPGFPAHVLPDYLDAQGIEYRIIERDTYSTVRRVVPEGATMCSLCSRLRRGILYGTATKLQATKIALGHHRDDILETLFLNLFYGGRMAAMPPKLRSRDGEHVVIRPLAYVPEAYTARYSELREFPIIPCDLCGSQSNLKRQAIKGMLQQWDAEDPKRLTNILRALQNVQPSQLADTELFDFQGLSAAVEGADPLGAIEDGPSPASAEAVVRFAGSESG
ncbi:tRNA 2-thiocytidine(32) synthetase TtcA [Arhodomonas sp. SL1]|uniref:tRNA 2-thiocytidine(32) synthetase TtcA n=1 Tax=Arhodomonas sp. SL1 TaxID=3425691 RepID=UPI003F8809D2